MIPIRQTITRRGTGCDRRTWRALLKRAYGRIGQWWHRSALPKHFTRTGAREYKYQKRSAPYMRGKGRRFGHQLPLVYRGDLRRQVRRMRDVRPSSKGARVVLHGPRHLHAYRKNYRQPNKAEELKALSTGDANAAARLLDRVLQRAIDAGGGRTAVLFSG